VVSKGWQRTLAVASVAAAAAWSLTAVADAVDAGLHAGYARALAGDSATQAVVLVDVADGADGPALAAALAGDRPRLVVDADGWTGCGLRLADGTCSEGHVPADRVTDTGTWVRPGGLVFAALAAIGAAPDGPLGVRYVRRLPTVPAARVVAGSIPHGTFTGRVVVVGRADASAASVATPLGPMSPAQVEAQALLGVLDDAALRLVPGWLRGAALVAWALVVAAALRRRGAAALVGLTVAALAVDAGLYAGGSWAIGAGAWIVAGLIAGALEAGLRVAARASARRAPVEQGAASGLHAPPRPSGPDQVSGA